MQSALARQGADMACQPRLIGPATGLSAPREGGRGLEPIEPRGAGAGAPVNQAGGRCASLYYGQPAAGLPTSRRGLLSGSFPDRRELSESLFNDLSGCGRRATRAWPHERSLQFRNTTGLACRPSSFVIVAITEASVMVTPLRSDPSPQRNRTPRRRDPACPARPRSARSSSATAPSRSGRRDATHPCSSAC